MKNCDERFSKTDSEVNAVVTFHWALLIFVDWYRANGYYRPKVTVALFLVIAF